MQKKVVQPMPKAVYTTVAGWQHDKLKLHIMIWWPRFSQGCDYCNP